MASFEQMSGKDTILGEEAKDVAPRGGPAPSSDGDSWLGL